MIELFASGRAVDLVLIVLAVEAVILVMRKWRAIDVALMLLPAALILLALRAALTGAAWPLVAIPLALSFPVHVADARRRRNLNR